RGAQITAIQIHSRFSTPDACDSTPPCVAAWFSDILQGLDHSVVLRSVQNIAAVNLSLGFETSTKVCDDHPMKPVIDHLRSLGVATVFSSGNDGLTDGVTAPACVSTAVSVASTSKTDHVSFFSNVAPFLSLFAPGESINSSVPGGGFAVLSGTS